MPVVLAETFAPPTTCAPTVVPNAPVESTSPVLFRSIATSDQIQRCNTTLRPDFEIISPFRNTFAMHRSLENEEHATFVKNTIRFRNKTKELAFQMCTGTRKIFEDPNAGGNSIWSEALSFEVLSTLLNARLLRTEMEIEYQFLGCKITDYSAEVHGKTLGVSVTRALKFNGEFTEEDGVALLTKKLNGINVSTDMVTPEHSWKKQILHVFAEKAYVADVLEKVYETQISPELKNNTIVIVTIAEANWIYSNS
mmetsp:Transcript_15079/g.21050  ORF Transcript_15079/g.21050 Transcript_15079/m.21050 type:complete len:253 (+) Transcript_15079:226-984(+)